MILLLMITSVCICLCALLAIAFILGTKWNSMKAIVNDLVIRVKEIELRKKDKPEERPKPKSELYDPDDIVANTIREHERMMRQLNE